ncbi:glycoside hydrolase family protein [Alteromonas sp. IB21]|uniref:glycoside hydrolase family protein n=1 Tax=Alteromonas sp. IB21 TaxID=2779369 RepID=UPI0018E8BC8E|nr:glycoside hydrolase family protein [Alteromonas sp. IB21]MBJ2129072.1 glycoside hydrolase family protein [Alteromonas sp. IB21]
MNYHATIEQIKRHEGLELRPYKCTAGKWTIGYGRNLEDNGISPSEAEEMLLTDMCEVEEQLFNEGLLDGLNDARKAVLINMGYQLGVSGLFKFKNMIAALDRKEYELAAKEMLDSRWAKQTPNRAKELADQMLTGEFQ